LHSLQANPLQETSEYCTAEIWLSGQQGKFHCRLLWLFYIYEHKPLCNVTTSRGLACPLLPSVQILFIHVYCIAVQSSVRKYDNICVTYLLFIFEAVSSTQHIYISFCTISYIWKHFSLQKNILQDTPEMCAKTQIKSTLFWCHFNWNEMDQQPPVKLFQYQM
jgi:hypothetical protein